VPTAVAAHLPVFEARDLTKVYHMGEVEVHAQLDARTKVAQMRGAELS
jgi:hypothetical protein